MKSNQRSFLFVLLSSLILCSCGPISVSSAVVSSQNHQETSGTGKTSSSTQPTSSKEQTPSSSKAASSSSSSQASSSSSSVDPAVKMTAFMKANGTYSNNQYRIDEKDNSVSSGTLTRHLFYSPSHNNYVGMSDEGHFTSSTGQIVYFESDQQFTLGSYLTTTVLFGHLNFGDKMISFKYTNPSFETNGDLKTYTYVVQLDQYGATDTQKADFAKAVAVYCLDCYQWARKKYAAYGGSFVS